MWLLLGENILDKFNIDNQSTYLLKVDKTNFLVGKNNSGKSYFLRFLLMNAIKIYNDEIELINDLKQTILSNEINFELLDRIENTNIKALSERYKKYITLLDKVYDSKKDSNSRYISNNQKSYNYENEHELLKEMQPLFDYLEIKQKQKFKLDTEIIPKYKDIKLDILKDLKEKLVNNLENLKEKDIVQLGSEMNTLIEKEKIKRYYFPILRNIRHPLKDTKSLYNDEAKIDIYKERIISEYKFESDIEIVTGLNFYQDYKKNLLGTKDKREKVDRFEKFLSNNFFNGDNVSIIPDEETFELKININDEEDKFIYQVGDGITSLLIIMYTIFMECDKNNYKMFFIEEPENNFHPGFQRLFINMITYFKEFEKCVFILSTHSNNLIDIGNRENKNSLIYLCKKENNQINISEKNEEYYDVIEELGVEASSVLIANKAIWVEGKYDAFYIRLLLNLKNINIEDSKKYMEDYDYCFIPYGGKNMTLIDFNSSNQEEQIKDFIVKAKKINPKYMVILDDDNMFEEDKKAKSENFKKLSKELGRNIYKLKVREVENLFPKEVIEIYIKQGIKKELITDELMQDLDIQYDQYKKQKLGKYINDKLLKKFNRRQLKGITGREEGFLKNGFLYDKLKFYKCVVEWSKDSNFQYEEKVTNEAKELINTIEEFIKKK